MTRLLAEEDINIISFTIAETSGYGLLRMIVCKPEKALEVLKANEYSASLTDVVIVEISTKTGTLHKLISILEDFDIDYLYIYSNREDISGIVLKIKEERIEEAEELIKAAGYKLVENYCL